MHKHFLLAFSVISTFGVASGNAQNLAKNPTSSTRYVVANAAKPTFYDLLPPTSTTQAQLDLWRLSSQRPNSVTQALNTKERAVLLLNADAKTLAELATRRSEMKAFAARGGWIVLMNLTPDGLANFNKVVGQNQMIRPLRARDRVQLRETETPLAIGINNRELATPNLFDYVVDYDDVAPFATLPSAASYGYSDAENDHDPYNVVNGWGTRDENHGLHDYGWKYVLTIPVSPGKAPAISMKWPTPQSVSGIEYAGNTNFKVARQLKISANGEAAQAIFIAPNNNPQMLKWSVPSVQELRFELSYLDNRSDKQLTGIDNIRVLVKRAPSFFQAVLPVDTAGGLVSYLMGRGGVVLCNIAFNGRESADELDSKRILLSKVLRNMGAHFDGPKTADGWKTFVPDSQEFGASQINLRDLNEKIAGENGAIISKDGRLVQSKSGAPIRLWGINLSDSILSESKASYPVLARRLARMGFNAARLATPVEGRDGAVIDEIGRDHLFALIAALKNEGIYSSLNVVYTENGYVIADSERFFLDDNYRPQYKARLRALLSVKNPYTGLALKDDAAVSGVEIVDYASLFNWTFQMYNRVPRAQQLQVDKMFGAWLIKRYGSLDKVFARWATSDVKLPGRGDEQRAADAKNDTSEDNAAEGRAGVRGVMDFDKSASPRAIDTARFEAEIERATYDDLLSYMRRDIGYKGLVSNNAYGWDLLNGSPLTPLYQTFPSANLDFTADKFQYISQGEYHGRGEWLRVGDNYNQRSMLKLNDAANKGGFSDWGKGYGHEPALRNIEYSKNGVSKPSVFSVVGWGAPNSWRADLPLTAVAYGSLQKLSAVYLWRLYESAWELKQDDKQMANTPTILAQSPAMALMFRTQMVKEGPVVVHGVLTEKAVLDGARLPNPSPQNPQSFIDAKAAKGAMKTLPVFSEFDPLSYLVGRVQLETQRAEPTQIRDLSPYVNRATSTVKSATGELMWNYGDGILRIDTPRAQGVSGFLDKSATVKLSDISISSALPYGTIIAVSLDDKPLKTSRRILVQAMSEERNFGWQTEVGGNPDERKVVSLGGAPLELKSLSGSVTFNNAPQISVTQLDANGDAIGKSAMVANVQLQNATMYYLVERK